MSDDRKHKDEAADQTLIKMIREAAQGDTADWPSETALAAFLQGAATSAQTAEVQACLGGSAQFRKQLVDLRHAVEALESVESQAAFDEAEVTNVPHNLIAQLSQQENREGFFQRLANLVTLPQWRVAMGATAAVLVIALSVVFMQRHDPEVMRGDPTIQETREVLVVLSTTDGVVVVEQLFEIPSEAENPRVILTTDPVSASPEYSAVDDLVEIQWTPAFPGQQGSIAIAYEIDSNTESTDFANFWAPE